MELAIDLGVNTFITLLEVGHCGLPLAGIRSAQRQGLETVPEVVLSNTRHRNKHPALVKPIPPVLLGDQGKTALTPDLIDTPTCLHPLTGFKVLPLNFQITGGLKDSRLHGTWGPIECFLEDLRGHILEARGQDLLQMTVIKAAEGPCGLNNG
jgi:hypothetical protein